MESARRLSFLLIGGADVIRRCGEHLLSRGHGVAHVVGRSPAVRDWAQARGLGVAADLPADARDLPVVDHIVSAANDLILPGAALARTRHGAFNLHNSRLPDYRGAFATTWAILDARSTHGASWHRITDRIDAGPVVAVSSFPIRPDDTAQTLNARCTETGFALFRDVLVPAIERGDVTDTATTPSPYFPVARRAPALGVLDWRTSAAQCARLVRALSRGTIDNSMDLAKIMRGGRCWSVETATVWDDDTVPPGTIRTLSDGRHVLGTADGALLLGGVAACGRAAKRAPALLPDRIEVVPDTLAEHAQHRGRAAATVENAALRAWARASRLPPRPRWPGARALLDGREWRKAAHVLLAQVRGQAGGAFRIDLRTPGIVVVKPELRALFCRSVPFGVVAEEEERALADRLAQADRDGPMLIDAWNRRTALRASVAIGPMQHRAGDCVAAESG